jgi:hypothetical protein
LGLDARPAGFNRGTYEAGRIDGSETVDSGEAEVGGIPVIIEVAQPQQGAALEDKACIGECADVRADVGKDIITLDGQRRKLLVICALGDEACGDHVATTASSSDGG